MKTLKYACAGLSLVALLSGCSALGPRAGGPASSGLPSSTRGSVGATVPAGTLTPSPSIYVPVPHSPKPPPSPTVNGGGGGTNGGSGGDIADFGPVRCSGQTHGVTQHAAAVSTRYTCFEIHGSSTNQLNAQMAKYGPHVDGTGRPAATKWKIAWSDSQSTDGSQCRVISTDVRLSIVFEFPHWNRPAGVDPSVAAAYDSFLNGVRKHEYTHRQIAIDGADQVAKAIGRVKPAASCGALSHRVNAAANTVLKETKQRQNALDAAASGG